MTMERRNSGGLRSLMLLLVFAAVSSDSTSPPGKPTLTSCRSPEKETFTCWWTPGSDGGLPTVHRLFYEQADTESIQECPDYVTGGANSCYFDKSQTRVWVEYHLTVVASNALGNTSSDTLKIDVVKILQAYPPRNVTMHVKQKNDNPFLYISWQSPLKTKPNGWITLEYELRVRTEKSTNWEVYHLGVLTNLSLHTVEPGLSYEVQVRCEADHNKWSEWSNSTFIKIPKTLQKEKPLWILMFVSLVPLLTAIGALIVKRKSVKQCLLPPVPGPKIIGVDPMLLKNGRSEDVVNALFGAQKLTNIKARVEQPEEYITVSDSKDWLLMEDYMAKTGGLVIINGVLLNSSLPGNESAAITLENVTDSAGDRELPTIPSQSENAEENVELPRPEQRENPDSRGAEAEAAEPPNACYVEIPPHEVQQQQQQQQQQQVSVPGDYSRVKEVDNQNLVVLEKNDSSHGPEVQKQHGGVTEDYSRIKEVSSEHQVLLQSLSEQDQADQSPTHCGKQKPLPMESSKGLCPQLLGNGYVDSIPNFSIK